MIDRRFESSFARYRQRARLAQRTLRADTNLFGQLLETTGGIPVGSNVRGCIDDFRRPRLWNGKRCW
jgi:hypothetical protein